MFVNAMKFVSKLFVLVLTVLLISSCSLTQAANNHTQRDKTVEDIYIEQLSHCYNRLTKKEGIGSCQYFLFDINCDSLPELFVKTGTCEVDFIMTTYVLKNKHMKKIFETDAGHCDFLKGKDYIIKVMAQSGSCYCYKITFENNQMKETNIFSGNCFGVDADSDFPEYSEQDIVLFDYDNTEPIKERLRKMTRVI